MVRRRGFTLIELLVTVTIVGILAGLALPLVEVAAQRSREQELRTALRDIRNALDAYKQAADEGRIARAADASGYPPNLEVLVEGVVDQTRPDERRIYFLRRLPRDPLAGDTTLTAARTWGLRSYKSPPDDPQPGEDVFDIYSRAAGIGLNGVPYRQW